MLVSVLTRCLAALAVTATAASAIQITGYTSGTHDRFSSGFPSSPADNGNPGFVGAGFDWSGVGWATSDATKGFALLSPRHFLVATHYGGAAHVALKRADGALVTGTQQSVADTGQGMFLTGFGFDLSLGTLNAPLAAPSQIARYGVLDLNATSSGDSPSAYNGLQVLLYGRGPHASASPRIGVTTVSTTILGGTSQIRTPRTDVQLETGDSGSPIFHGWTNPDGAKELALLGLHSAINVVAGINFHSFMGNADGINAYNALMTPTGFALRVVGSVTGTWAGFLSTDIGSHLAWVGLAPSDAYVLFNGSTAASGRAVTVNTNHNLRGLYFKSTTASGDAFTFGGSSTLTIGRGGVTNYDDARQVFNAKIALGDHQVWDVGPGGVSLGALDTAGKLLEVYGSASAQFNGVISGSGGVALTYGRMDLSANNTYTGKTWAHSGRLQVNGNIASSEGVILGASAGLFGTGTAAPISGAGSVNPGNSVGILTAAQVLPAGGLDFDFEFTLKSSPIYGAGAASGNDVLRLTSATPFLGSLSAQNRVRLFLDVGTLALSDTLRGGFFTDLSSSFLSSIEGATFEYFVADPFGPVTYNGVSYSAYSGPFTFAIGTVAETAAFASGSVSGRVLEFVVVPEPSSATLLAFALLLASRRTPSRCHPHPR